VRGAGGEERGGVGCAEGAHRVSGDAGGDHAGQPEAVAVAGGDEDIHPGVPAGGGGTGGAGRAAAVAAAAGGDRHRDADAGGEAGDCEVLQPAGAGGGLEGAAGPVSAVAAGYVVD